MSGRIGEFGGGGLNFFFRGRNVHQETIVGTADQPKDPDSANFPQIWFSLWRFSCEPRDLLQESLGPFGPGSVPWKTVVSEGFAGDTRGDTSLSPRDSCGRSQSSQHSSPAYFRVALVRFIWFGAVWGFGLDSSLGEGDFLCVTVEFH